MLRRSLLLACVAALAASPLVAAEHPVPGGKFGRLDHVFLIIMENETDTDILGNDNAPFINAYAHQANHASNYFAVGHPSAPNYLEITGGSNFGLKDDYWPDWTGKGCIDHAPNSRDCEHALPPIDAPALDNAVVATARDASQCNGQIGGGGTPVPNNCALHDYPAVTYTPESIADQLVRSHKSWKSYQESLPTVDSALSGVNYSDGAWSNLSPAAAFAPAPIQKLYAVKHNPFAYFRRVQAGERAELSLQRVADFEGPDGLWANLQGQMPNFALIVPNQCHDMHGFVKGGTAICGGTTPLEWGLLIAQGDATVGKLVAGIKASPAWKHGRNAIVLVWDENDFTNAANRVVMLVETSYGRNGHVSAEAYDHYSLLRTLEAGFGLPCLNHACDSTSRVMNDLFGG
jgi:hypothetical protein